MLSPLQARLQRGPDAGRAVPGGRGAHLLCAHAPGGHAALPAHGRAPPQPAGPAAPPAQPHAAGRGIPGENEGPPSHCPSGLGAAGRPVPVGPWETEPQGLQEGEGSTLCPAPHPDPPPDAGNEAPPPGKRGEGGYKGGHCSHTSSPAPARGSPQTSSALKTWIFLVMPPRTDIRPSCQVRTAVGLGWRRSGGETASARRGLPCMGPHILTEGCPCLALAREGVRNHASLRLGPHCGPALLSVALGSRCVAF